MPDPRVEEPLNDAAFDRELEELLGAEPSAEFVARVRARVAIETRPARLGWRLHWVTMTTGVVVAAALVIMIGRVPRSGPANVPRSGPAGSAQRAATRAPADVSRSAAPDVGRVPRSGPAGADQRSGARDPGHESRSAVPLDEPFRFAEVNAQPLVLPEVLISPDEQRALARLRFRQDPIETDGEPEVASLRPVAAIEIPDIEVAPLRQIAALEIQGDRP